MTNQLSTTPYNFVPGEYTLIAYAAFRFGEALAYHSDQLPDNARHGDGDDEAEAHGQRALTALRRAVHFGLYCLDIENGQRNVTRRRIDRDRADFCTAFQITPAALADLGIRYLISNHRDKTG